MSFRIPFLDNLPDAQVGVETAMKVLLNEQKTAGLVMNEGQKRLITGQRNRLVKEALTRDLPMIDIPGETGQSAAKMCVNVIKAELKVSTRIGSGLGIYLGAKLKGLEVVETEQGMGLQRKK
jgi:hypothetical protein